MPVSARPRAQFSRQRTGHDGLHVSLVDDAEATRVVHGVHTAHVHPRVGDARVRDGHAALFQDLQYTGTSDTHTDGCD